MLSQNVLTVKGWQVDPDYYQLVVTDPEGTPIIAEQVSVGRVQERFGALLKGLAEKGVQAKKVYVPLWLSSQLKNIVLDIYPKADVFIDYNE